MIPPEVQARLDAGNEFGDITNGANKKEVVERISKMLRQMATNVGLKIDEIYRNVNGINAQRHALAVCETVAIGIVVTIAGHRGIFGENKKYFVSDSGNE